VAAPRSVRVILEAARMGELEDGEVLVTGARKCKTATDCQPKPHRPDVLRAFPLFFPPHFLLAQT
jgi:hypothetical protein